MMHILYTIYIGALALSVCFTVGYLTGFILKNLNVAYDKDFMGSITMIGFNVLLGLSIMMFLTYLAGAGILSIIGAYHS